MCTFVRNYQTVLQSGCTILHSHQQRMRVPVAPHPHSHLLFSVFQILAILVSIQWYLALICISLMTYDVEHLFICLLAICVSSLVRCLFRSFAIF